MSYSPRSLVEEHLVRKDENGYSLDHALVSDTSRSLIQELEDTAQLLNRIKRMKQSQEEEKPKTDVRQISSKDIERLLRYVLNKNEKEGKDKEPRKLINNNDIYQ